MALREAFQILATLGTKVKLAGRTAILPNDNVPFVVQRLTMGQINAIPKDRFAVSLIETPMAMAAHGRGTERMPRDRPLTSIGI